MPRVDNELRILPSILDRLLDDEPEVLQEPMPNGFQNLRQIKKVIRRDLEALLNTRQEALQPLPPEYAEVSRSLITYGLPDFTIVSLLSPHDRNRVRRALEQAIAAFEPRLERVHVTLEPPRQHEQVLRFRIEAVLPVQPAPEPVIFDALLQMHTQTYVIRGND